MPDGTATAHLYRPKLVTVLHEGYSLNAFRRDLLAALTVAIVALPLSMAIAVASGVSPERGLYTSIIGGFAVSALGGSRFQIGGPAGAFIVLVAATVAKFGIEGLLLTVLISGALLTLIGALRLGSLIRHIPHPVTVGFTAGIAVTILASQLKDLGGFRLTGPEPGVLIPKLIVLAHALPTLNFAALGVGVGSAALIFLIRRYRPNWPGMLIAVVAASAIAALAHLPVETIATRFGALPHGLLPPALPKVSWQLVVEVLPAALSFTLLGGIESLLSAKVADSMTGRKHRANMELVAQGIANMASAPVRRHQRDGDDCPHRHQYPRRAHAARSPGSCMRASCCCSCWWRRRWPASCHSRRWRVFLSCRRLLEYGGEGRVCPPPASMAACRRSTRHLRGNLAQGPDLRHLGRMSARSSLCVVAPSRRRRGRIDSAKMLPAASSPRAGRNR